MASASFDADYFVTAYQDYGAQNPPRKLEFYRSLLDQYAPDGGRVLDLGCAFGLFLDTLGPQWQRYGVDASTKATLTAKYVAKARTGSAECPPFPGPWEAITAFDTLEHVADLDAVGQYLSTTLKPGGVCLIVVPVYDGPLGWLVRLLDHDPTHVHKESRDWWVNWISRHLEVVEWRGIFRRMVGGYYIHWPTRALRCIAPAIMIVARRKA
jgi:SAM-dependent methyltransferase